MQSTASSASIAPISRPNGEGKAKAIEPVKRFIGPVGGGAVRLAPAVDTVAVCEGIETGLSYMEATGTPTWAALSARGIRSLILPDESSRSSLRPILIRSASWLREPLPNAGSARAAR